jgi:glycosyltransferase involved in cell wall biosynthesis
MENSKNKIELVSIAMATYNGEQFIEKQLDSLLAQTYSNLEIIISDDGSTDSTIAIVERYMKAFASISLFKNPVKNGINKNFENAIKHCKGDFVALCDQDDIWLPQKIETLINNIGSAALVYHNSLFIDADENSMGRTIADKLNCYSGQDSKTFLLLNCVSGHECMFAKRLINIALPIPSAKYFDWWLAFVAAENGGVKYIDEVLVHYRQHEKSKTDMLALKKTTKHKKEFLIYEEELEWYNSCAKVAIINKSFYELWAKYYKQRKNQWFSFSLFLLARNNAKTLYFIKKKSSISRFFESLKLLWGLKMKTFFS